MSARNASAMSCAASCATSGLLAVASMLRIGLAATVLASKVTSLGIFVVAANRVIVAGSLKIVIYPTMTSAASVGLRPGSANVVFPTYVGRANNDGPTAADKAS